ncbi:tRNA glutamyl-Q(34) synthetase GluQRS [Thalassolituus oleivorans]|uniref:tRNA glutamyl-Q(34) synthetase GluQRS n=1 Tax=Thalassolituus oleivorans TaxID=187493 RepID=UPI0023F32F7D|nr:tRNA glutamyl-Q(34) synthetase GluQRS [Thalassolituus oleivorans]
MTSSSNSKTYRGRFAPSPTGPLHFGSLLAAVASYLDARAHHGTWLVRIEDLDPPREDPTAADSILHTLDHYGLHWDEDIRYQSTRSDAYNDALQQLILQQLAFPCACSRKQLGNQLHHGICSTLQTSDIAWRFLCPAGQLRISDTLQATQTYELAANIGDFVIRRRDGLWSYQLAVAVDDADQGITHVVRGIDLIDSTARQVLLQQALGYSSPIYSHIPVANEANGQKLSKQNLALSLSTEKAADTLWLALAWLKQSPPAELRGVNVTGLLTWAIANWQAEVLIGLTSMPAPGDFQRQL